MKPLSEWTVDELAGWISCYRSRMGRQPEDVLAELLRREREAMQGRCLAVLDEAEEYLRLLAGTALDTPERLTKLGVVRSLTERIRGLQ